MGLVASEKDLILAQFVNEKSMEFVFKSLKLQENVVRSKNGILVEVARQLQLYFKGKLRQYSLPLKPTGTPFQKRVWRELRSIPYGATRSYHEIAQAIGNARAARAVGLACNANPIAIIIPCHRVVGTDGDPTGYSAGVEKKLRLIELENRSRDDRP